MINIILGWPACEGYSLAGFIPQYYIQLLIVVKAQVEISKNIEGIFNLIIG